MYIFFNEKKFVQSRLIAVNLTQFYEKDGQNGFLNTISRETPNVESMMNIGQSIDIDLHSPILCMVKQPIIVFLDSWESVAETTLWPSSGQFSPTSVMPSTMSIYSKPRKDNANLSAMEAMILKVFYIPPMSPDLQSSSWYKEEELLKSLPENANLPDITYAWFFNSTEHLKRCLLDAVKRARLFYSSSGPSNLRECLPAGSGLTQLHIDHIKFEMDPSSSTRTKIEGKRESGNLRKAAIYGLTSSIAQDMVLKRLLYVKCAKKAKEIQQESNMYGEAKLCIFYAASQAKLYHLGFRERDIPTFLEFMADNPYLQSEPTTTKRGRTSENSHQPAFKSADQEQAGVGVGADDQPSRQRARMINQRNPLHLADARRRIQNSIAREHIQVTTTTTIYRRINHYQHSTTLGKRFSEEEKRVIVECYEKHKSAKNVWKDIMNDSTYSKLLEGRSARQVRDKLRDMGYIK